ncbi:MAG TPA: zinc-binding alcohol dehydrogenase family protein [Pyrinomonadaceae bacterium]|nr:zinc-binding alcohol dehydrogenase family protein [Pyrinomonadaceae bacterium]
MKNFAVCGERVKELLPDNDSIEMVEIKGHPVTCGIIPSDAPRFDARSPEHETSVLLQVRAFSCNYRDMNLIFTALKKGPGESFFSIGSEFVGEVLEVGSKVTSVRVGDRVIGDCFYHGGGRTPARQGVVTNHASKEYQIVAASKVIRIPKPMPDDVAASFTIGAQTTYSMVRKLGLEPGANVLVTAAKSNTSLFAINALKAQGVNVYATTTSPQHADKLKQLGLKELFVIDSDIDNFIKHEHIRDVIAETGGFDGVIDPFFDIHLPKVLDVMAPGAKYVTCGLHEQYQKIIGQATGYQPISVKTLLLKAMFRNLHIIGNCIGTTADLQRAIDDYSSNSLPVVVDSRYSGKQAGAFLDRTYNSGDRFGKVVYQYV